MKVIVKIIQKNDSNEFGINAFIELIFVIVECY